MAKTKGLGRGLGALLPAAPKWQDASASHTGSGAAMLEERRIELLPIEQIRPNPDQPRQTFDEAAMEELAASVRQYGVLQPILVRPVIEIGRASCRERV